MSFQFAKIDTPETMKNGKQKAASTAVLRSKVPVNKLALSNAQRAALDSSVQARPEMAIDAQFDQATQSDALAFLVKHKLDPVSFDEIGSKWATQWSNSNKSFKHILYQCHCGYDHRLQNSTKHRIPYGYTACLAHTEVIIEQATGHIRRVQGVLEHNKQCGQALLLRVPILPLHPSVFEVALEQLHNGATLSKVQVRNLQMVEARRYRGQSETLGQYRYLLRKYDSQSLYHQFYWAQGIDLKKQPHNNIHNWLDPKSLSFNPELAQAIFHYSARTERDNRLEVCIATNKMKQAAWCYGHGKQILLDGTFGVCDQRLLLFIVMGVDKQNHGIPLTFLLFSAPAGNKFTSGGYNTSILLKLLTQWRDAVSAYGQREFKPAVAITNTDFKERGALLGVFRGIQLLICRFHLRQAWANHRTKSLRGNAPGLSTIRDRLIAVENQIVQSTDYMLAWGVLHREIAALNHMAENPSYAAAAAKGLVHLQYLASYWMAWHLWQSWSEFGQVAVAAVIGIPLEGVIPTTNHLESFNGVLKHKHLRRWSRGGRRVRADTLVNILATKIAPSIFQQRRLEEERVMLRRALKDVPGASQLLGGPGSQPIEPPVAFLEPDTRRDHDARMLLQSNRISAPIMQQAGIQLTCWSLSTVDPHGSPVGYFVWLGYDSNASCACPDFQQRGGACKHIRAALIHVRALRDWAVSYQLNELIAYTPNIELPASKAAATRLRAHANRYVLVSGRGAASTDTNQYDAVTHSDVRGIVARVAHCINEALQGGFLGDLDDVGEPVLGDLEPGDELGAGSDQGETDDGLSLSSSGCEFDDHEYEGTSAQGLAEQVIARTTYTMKKNMKLIPEIHAALDHIHYRDLEASEHRAAYEQYADELELMTTRIRSLLRRGAPSAPATQVTTSLSQHNTAAVPIPASPERRQYRKDSRSFH